jgi:protein TonB
VRLIIDGNGRVAHCHVTNFLTAKALRDAACDAMIENARFDPAKDADGNPATDFAFQQVRYVLGGRQRSFSADAHGFAIDHD